MRYLLDTSSLIWALISPNKLSHRAAFAISDFDAEIYISVISLWEIEIKAAQGRLPGFENLEEYLDSEIKFQQFHLLNLTRPHVHELGKLPLHHKDPFDRILISQAIHEDLVLIAKDGKFAQYPVRLLW